MARVRKGEVRVLEGRMSLFAAGSVLVAALIGIAAGIGGFTFFYAKGGAYLGSDPAACANCHVMEDHHAAWSRSSHRAVAVCNDCHAPHSFVPKYWVKAVNGWNHSRAFTTGDFPDPIRVTDFNRQVTEAQCRHCHQPIVDAIDPAHAGEPRVACIRCHSQVGHAL